MSEEILQQLVDVLAPPDGDRRRETPYSSSRQAATPIATTSPSVVQA